MEIIFNRQNNELDATLQINLSINDIENDIDSALRKHRQKFNLPGFRPGNVPFGLVKKHIGESVTAEILEKKLEESINQYAQDNNLLFIKPAIPEKQDNKIDLKQDKEFQFNYIMGIYPQIEFDLSAMFSNIEKLEYEITENQVDEEIEKIRYAHVDYKFLEQVEEGDDITVSASVKELDSEGNLLENGLNKMFFKKWNELSDELKQWLRGKEIKEEYKVNLNELFPDKKYMADLLKIEQLEAEDCGSDALIKILNISRNTLPELNEEFYKKASYDKANTVDEFREYVLSLLKEKQDQESNHLIDDLIFEALTEKMDYPLPEHYLNTLFELENQDNISNWGSEKFQEEKERFFKRFKWSMIIDQYSSKNKIEVEDKEVINNAYHSIINFYYQQGYYNVKNEDIQKTTIEYLKDKNNYLTIKDRVLAGKVIEHLKNSYEFKSLKVSKEEFERIHKEKHSHEH